MSAGFWKRNEKIIMTLLLLVLAPAFAFTGIMTWWLTEGRVQGLDIYEIHGEDINVREYQMAKEDLGKQLVANQLRINGPFAFPPYRRPPGAGERMTIEYLSQMHLVESLGLRTGATQRQNALRDAALDVLSWYRVMEKRNWEGPVTQDDSRALFAEYSAARDTATFNPDEYRQALMSGKMGVKLSVEAFEEAVAQSAQSSLLFRALNELAIPSEKEMYEDYATQRRKASVEFVQISSDRFSDEARGAIDEEYLRAVYDENVNIYRKSAAFTLKVAKADRAKFTDPDYQPTREEIVARYEADKATRYRKPRGADWVPPENYDPEVDDYRDLVTVFTQVETSVKDSHAQEQEKVVLGAAIEKAAELTAAGTEFTLEDLFSPEDREKLIFDNVDWFTRGELNTIDRKYLNVAVLSSLFSDPSVDRIGELSAEPVPVRDGDYIYQIAGVEGPRTESFEEAIAKVTENAERKKAKELCKEFLAEWSKRIADEEETTFETFASTENYTIHASEEPLDRFSGYKLKIDDRQVTAGRTMIQQVFDEGLEPGEVTAPVEYQFDDSLYLAKLVELVPPPMDQWLTALPGLEQSVRSRRLESINSRFEAQLEAMANPQALNQEEPEPAAGS